MLKAADLLIKKFAAWISRGSRADGRSDGKSRQTLAVLSGVPIVFTILVLMAAVIPWLVTEAQRVDPRPFAENIPADDWLATYTDDEATLWRVRHPRYQYPHSQELDRRHGQTYWIGTEIGPEMVRRAQSAEANLFFIGYIVGDWEVYVDSKLVKKGGLGDVRRPVIIQIPEVSFRNPNGFRVGVRIVNSDNAMYPDTLFFTGLGTERQIETHRRWQDFMQMITNSMAFGTNLALGIFFLALWLCGLRKQELAAFAAFGLLHAAIQAESLPLIGDYLGSQKAFRFNFITKSYEAVLVIWLGLALARIRSFRISGGIFVALALPWLIFLTPWSPNQIYHLTYFMTIWSSPGSYFIAAFLCLAQARLVSSHHRQDLVDPSRIIKLHASWIALVAMGLVELYGNRIYIDTRILNISLLVGLAAAVVHDFRRQELFIRRAPLSRYHQKAELPKRVSCVLAAIDLKRSESLYQFGSAQGVGGAYVAEIISQFYRTIVDRGGEVIQTEGDSITFFFDRDENDRSVIDTVDSIRGLDQLLKFHVRDFRDANNKPLPQDLRLRAALSVGAIRPTWQRFEGRDVPSWEQTSDSSVFVDIARLLEAEAKAGNKSESSIIVQRDLAEEALGASVTQLASVVIKHERKVDVSIASLG